MPRSKQADQAGKVEGAFGKEKSDKSEPMTVSGATPGSTPSPGKSKSSDPKDKKD
jgi:hypothetical protein